MFSKEIFIIPPANSDCKWKTKKIRQKKTCCLLTFGLFFLLLSLVIALFFRRAIHDLVDGYILQQNALTSNSMMTQLWQNPPLMPQLKVYVFNVTNSKEFLQGKEKLKVQELGPYIYNAAQIKDIHQWNDEEQSITFRSKTTYQFAHDELSKNPDMDEVVIPNLLMMTGMLKTEVHPQPDFIKKSVIWPILTSVGFKEPFIKLKVSEFLWGYEDELACLDTNPKEDDLFSDFQDDDFFKDEQEEKQESSSGFAQPARNYRQNGKCIFGALIDKNSTWDNLVEMKTGGLKLSDKGRILSIGGSSIFGMWQQDSSCDQLYGTREPSALPPTEQQETTVMDEFDMLMGIMCRSVRMETIQNVDYSSFHAKRFALSPNTFKQQINACYDPIQDLPDGIMNVAKCCQGSPLVVSSPHFLHADQWYLDQVEGISLPNPVLHELYVDLEPHLGALVGVQGRFQLNLVVRQDTAFPPLSNLTEAVTVIPVFWAQEGYDVLPDSAMQKLKLALMLPNLFADCLIIACVVIGVILVLWPLLQGIRNFWNEQQVYKYNFKIKAAAAANNSAVAVKKSTLDTTYNPLPLEDHDSQL